MNDGNDDDLMKAGPQRIQRSDIKSVGKSGQISLGKRYAGKTFCVRQRSDGSLLLTAVAMVPESQLWTLREPDRSAIIQGMSWAASAPPSETDLDDLAARASRPSGSRLPRRARRPRAASTK